MPKKALIRFFNISLGAEIWLPKFINEGQLSFFFFKSSHNIETGELIICLETAWIKNLSITFNKLTLKLSTKPAWVYGMAIYLNVVNYSGS